MSDFEINHLNPRQSRYADHTELIKSITLSLANMGIHTPFLAVDGDKIVENAQRWQRLLPSVTPFYAIKANTDPLVLQLLFEAGVHADVASAFEIDTCSALQLPPERMILSNPRKDAETIRSLAQHGLYATTVDSEIEIHKLAEQLHSNLDNKPLLFLRIKVPTDGVQQDLSSKFGIRVLAASTRTDDCSDHELELEQLIAIAKQAKSLGFDRLGLAFHVGTQCYQGRVYATAVQLCLRIGRELRKVGLPIEAIDIGGGFADGTLLSQKMDQPASKSLEHFLTQIAEACSPALSAGYAIVAEPGRYMVADSGTLVTQVAYDQSTQHTGRRIQIDDGIFRTLSGRIHDGREFQFHPFRIHNSSKPFLPVHSRFAIWGCSCDSFDKVAEDIFLPADLKVGDYLLIPTMGAYSTSFGSNTNGFHPATTVLYRRKGDKILWQVTPLEQQKRLLLDHIRDWHTESKDVGRVISGHKQHP